MRLRLLAWLLSALWALPAGADQSPLGESMGFRFSVDPPGATVTLSVPRGDGKANNTKQGPAEEPIYVTFYENAPGAIQLELTRDNYGPYRHILQQAQMKEWPIGPDGNRVCPERLQLSLTFLGFFREYPWLAASLLLGALGLLSSLKLLDRRRQQAQEAILAQRRRDLELGMDLSKDPMLGTIVGRYYLAERLGIGGMAAVYRAIPVDSYDANEAVALKIVRMDRDSSDARRRFRREAQITTQLNHPNVVRLLEIGGEEDFDYFIMELVEGHPLRVPPQGMTLEEVRPIVTGIFEGLCYAHKLGIVHRDLKPENIMITSDGTVKLLDFGLARSRNLPTLTRSSVVVGTPAYIAPEQVTGHNHRASVDPRSDQYSLGVSIYEMLAGRRPFEHEDAARMVNAHLRDVPEPLSNYCDRASPELEAVIQRMLEKQPQDRFATTAEAYQAWRKACL